MKVHPNLEVLNLVGFIQLSSLFLAGRPGRLFRGNCPIMRFFGPFFRFFGVVGLLCAYPRTV